MALETTNDSLLPYGLPASGIHRVGLFMRPQQDSFISDNETLSEYKTWSTNMLYKIDVGLNRAIELVGYTAE